MLERLTYGKKSVIRGINDLYEAIDKSIESGEIAKYAEKHGISKEEAAYTYFCDELAEDFADFICGEIIDEVVYLVRALYWAREQGEDMAYPMKERDVPNPAQDEFYNELGTAIKEAPEKARQAKKERDQKEFDRITKDFSDWADNTISKMEQDFPFLKQD